MSINYTQSAINEMRKAIGDVGEGVPFDQIGLSVEMGSAVLHFYREGKWLMHSYAHNSDVFMIDAKGHVKVDFVP